MNDHNNNDEINKIIITRNNTDKNSNNNEILFWKVINNKYLLKLIFHLIKTIEWYDYFNNGISTRDRFRHRKSFKNITSFNWMIESSQIQLLHCKLKNNEYIQTDQKSIYILIDYFSNNNKNSSTQSPQSSLSQATEFSLFKDIVSLIFRNNVIRIQDFKHLIYNNRNNGIQRNIFSEEVLKHIYPYRYNGKSSVDDNGDNNLNKRIKYSDGNNDNNEAIVHNSKTMDYQKYLQNQLPEAWHSLIPSIYKTYISNSILVDNQETYDWIFNNQKDLGGHRLKITFSSFKLAKYATSIVLPQENHIMDAKKPNVYIQSSFLYHYIFLKSIYECNIGELEYMNANEISINWKGFEYKYRNVESIAKFSNQIDLIKLNELIDCLNSINYFNFDNNLYINFIKELVYKLKSTSTSSTEILSFLNKLQTPNYQYLHQLLNDVINESLPSEIIEFCINHHYNTIKIHSKQIIENYNSKSKYFKISVYGTQSRRSDKVGVIISYLELLAKYNISNQTQQEETLLACNSIIQYLFSGLIMYSNVSNEKLKLIHQVLNDSSITIQQDHFHSIYYLLQRSPHFIIYMSKITFDCDVFQLDTSIFTFEFIFGSSYDEILDKLIRYLSSIPTPTSRPNRYIDNPHAPIDYEVFGYYSNKTLNLNLQFYLSIHRIDLFFKLLNSIQQKLQDTSFNDSEFPSNIINENEILANDYKSSLHKMLIKTRMADVEKTLKYTKGWTGYYLEYHFNTYSNSTETLINGTYDDTHANRYTPYIPLNICVLFSTPFYKFKYWKSQQSQDQDQSTISNTQFQLTSTYNVILEQEFIESYQQEINTLRQCKHCCGNVNDLTESLVEGRIFYPNKKVYHKTIENMGSSDLLEFIKFCSYRSFIHFLYSYNIKVKLILLHYQLVNHILLNHNHNYQNNNDLNENYQFLLNYWDTILTFNQIMPKSLFDLQKFIKSTIIPQSTILNRLTNSYIPKSIKNYKAKLFKQKIQKQQQPPPDEYEYIKQKEQQEQEVEFYFNQLKEFENLQEEECEYYFNK